MPVTAVKPNATSKFESEVQQQLAQVARRIRTHDLLCGVFLLGAVAFGYLALVIAFDRWLDLPAWVRQLGFVGLLAALGAVAYYGIVRPLRRTVNPLYAAREIEETVEDAKNSVVNWVDLQDKPMAEGVRAVVAARAAKQFKDADLDKAGESKRLLWLGGTTAGLVVVLAVLFMLFKPTVFNSLVGRAINPFSSGQIATRTQLTIVEPKDGDLTVTAGQPVTISVVVNGKVPAADAPDHLVVMLRHNLADENYDEVPLESGATSREWSLRLPERLVQNGFWYRVKGGDAETAEHHVTVRPKPMFTDFEVKYDYPAYLRMTADVAHNPHLEAHRGTVVTVTAKANRTVRDGRAVLTKLTSAVPGEIVTESRDSLRVRFPLEESGTYRLLFNSTDGESNPDAPVYDIRVLTDQPPSVVIANPKDEVTSQPVNGSLMVDGQIGDDFGIDSVTLQLKIVAPNQPAKRLKGKPYLKGESLKRAADGTYPTALEYKDSIALSDLKDEAGAVVELKPDMTIEYWLEARDNCTVPEANVGKSRVQKLQLTAAMDEPKAKEQVQKQAELRRRDEGKVQQDQKQKLDKEQRPANPSPQKQNAEAQQPPEGGGESKVDAPKPGDPMNPAEKLGDPMKPEAAPTKPGAEAPMPKTEPGAKADVPPEPMPATNPKEEPSNKAVPMGNDPGKAGQPMPPGAEPQPMPAAEPKNRDSEAATKRELQRQAQDLQKKLDEREKRAGEGKGNDQPQPDPQAAGGEKKAKPKAGEAGEGKPPAEQKPSDPADQKGGDPQEKQGPLGGAGATEKPADGREKKSNVPKPNEQGGAPGADAQPQPDNAGAGRSQKPATPGEAKKGPKPDDAPNPKSEPKGAAPSETKPTGDPSKESAATKGDGKAEQQAAGRKGERDSKENPWQRGAEKQNPGNANDPAAAKQQEMEQSLKDLAGGDEKAKQSARKKLDQEFGKDAREKAERTMNERKQVADDLQSNDPMRQARGQEKANELQREAMEKNKPGQQQERKSQKGDAETLDRKETEKAVDNLNSDDKNRQEAGRKKLDEMVGEKARKDAEKMNEDLKSGDKDRQQGAAEELQKMQKKQQQAAQQQRIQEAAQDLAGNDEQKKQAAQDKLDKEVGKEARENLQKQLDDRKKTAEDLKSNDPMQKARGEEKLNELQKEQLGDAAKDQKGGQPGEAQKKEIEDAARGLNSDDPQKREAAQKKLDQMVGKDARQQAEKLRDDLKSGDKDRQKAAADELQRLQKQQKQQEAQQQAAQQKDMEKAVQDLAGGDEKKKEEARKTLDKAAGEQARKDAEKQIEDRKKAAEDLKSNDPMQKARGEDKLNDLQQKELGGAANDQKGGAPDEAKKKELQDAARDLNSDDPQKREAAQRKLDQMVGKDARQQAEKLRDDLKSDDKERQQGAKDQLKKLQEQAEKQAQQNKQKGGAGDAAEQAAKQKEMENAAKDLAGNDEQKKKAAQEKLDKEIGKDAREDLQKRLDERKQVADDLNSKDPARQARGRETEKRLQREDAERGSGKQQPDDANRLDRKEIEEALKDLNSNDEAKKQAARDKLDKAVGEDARKKAEQTLDDLKSDDPARQKGAVDELTKMQKDAEKQAKQDADKKDQKGEKTPSAEDVEKLAKAAQDLKSADEQKRKDAQKQLDDQVGEQERKKLEEQLKDGQKPSPEQLEGLKKTLEQAMKNQPNADQGPGGPKGDLRQSGGPGINPNDDKVKPLEANKEFDKEAAQLLLDKTKKLMQNKDAAKELGYTEEELKRFNDGLEKMLRETPDAKEGPVDQPKPGEPARPTNRVDGSGKVEQRGNGSKSTTNATGVSAAPPGYSDARRKFAEGATKPSKDKDEKK
ncbi:DUF4175 family protein [Limnoglobus roseus]|uniref:Large adhesin n=1 Tax=Limnoglobus roseus TaxID=2598579 RepID=A0A5C1AGC3_9BACT|nr:DUF4175 family protein [Limnoglobus roseus]QEL18261.1 large adhesin [Limnoglobus roseus]